MGRMISSREFNQNPSEAKRAAEDGPVIVTDRGEPAFVLLRYDTYRRLSGEGARFWTCCGRMEMKRILISTRRSFRP